MYLYKDAVGVRNVSPKGQEFIDISEMPLGELPVIFSELVIILHDQIADREVSIKLEDYRNEFAVTKQFIQEWLDESPNRPLKTSNHVPKNKPVLVTMHDIQYEWFELLPGHADLGEGVQDELTVSGARDIRVRKVNRDNFDHSKLNESVLWTINGHMVRGVVGKDSVYLINASKHFKVYDNIHVGCMNFNTLAKVKTTPIKKEDIRVVNELGSIRVHIRTNESLENKTVWGSIGGRLYFKDVLVRTGEKSLVLKIRNVDWASRLFDSKQYIDLSNIVDKERSVIPKEFFETEEFFTKLLTDLSSFLIIIDDPHIHVDIKPLTVYRYPFTYHTHETRPLPLITGDGMLPKYFTRQIINRRLLDIDLKIQRKYVNETTGVHNEGNLHHDFTNRYEPSHYHTGYLMYIRGLAKEK